MDRNAATEARSAQIFRQATALAAWLGEGKRALTPGGVLRRPDVPAAAAALGVTVPAKFRSAADLRQLNRPWAFGVAAGLIQPADGKASPGSAPDNDEELLDRWLAGVRAVCAAETPENSEDGVLILVLTVLEVLDGETIAAGLPPDLPFWRVVGESLSFVAERYDKSNVLDSWMLYRGDRRGDGLDDLVPLLAALGVATGTGRDLRITELGRWARHRLAEGLPAAVDPSLPAAAMIAAAARFADERTRAHVASDWLDARDPVAAVREIMRAADTMNSSERIVATLIARTLSDDGIPAWRELTAAPCAGPHATMTLWMWEEIEEVPEADDQWLAVEQAAAQVAQGNTDEALSILWQFMPGETIEACVSQVGDTGHPEAELVVKAIAGFLASGAARSVDQVVQLKVTLKGYRPATWRSVRLCAIDTLEDLHFAIQTLFGWGGDHLYAFRVGKEQYSGRFGHLEETGYDCEVRLSAVFPKVKKIEYVYDLGAYWEHEITLEKILSPEEGTYPVCVGFSGDNPVEYPRVDDDYDEEDEQPEPFDIDDVNRRLTGV